VKRANRLMLIFGVILAVVSFVVVLAFGGLGNQGPAPVTEVAVVVAAADLPLGTAITADKLTTVNRPTAEAEDTYKYPEELVGRVVRRPVAAGQSFKTADFESGVSVPQLAASLASGLRGVAVPLSRVDSVGGLLQPGDWVDAILTMEDLDALNPVAMNNPGGLQVGSDGSVSPPFITLDEYVNNTTVKVVVQNVQVLAALPPVGTVEDNFSGTATVEPDLIVVLAVNPQQAEVIRFAQLDGHISLALRAPADYAAGQVPTTGITLQKLVEDYGVLPPLPVTP
jgi:Flp pilus assembly protein CpaB